MRRNYPGIKLAMPVPRKPTEHSIETMELMNLPDEILLHILSFDDEAQVSVGTVNLRLDAMSQAHIRKQPDHHVIGNRAYLREQVYSSPELLLTLFRDDAIDVPWLVKGTTDIIRGSGLNTVAWYILQCSAYFFANKVAEAAAKYVAKYPPLGSTWDAGGDAYVYNPGDYVWSDTGDAAGEAVEEIVDYKWLETVGGKFSCSELVTEADVKSYLLRLDLTCPADIGRHAYQIAQCLMLRKINREVCDKIDDLTTMRFLDDITYQIDTIPMNPWIEQYHELYPSPA